MVKVIGINRNIMECKERTVTGNNRAVLCINRNIMECKELFKWSLQFPDLRINRNIMECKDRWPDISSSFIAVLIETLWNVKDGLYNGSVWCETVLIETLWNVKLERSRSTGTVGLGINRNIMECKVWIASVSMDALMY